MLSDLGIAHSAGLPLVEGLLTIDIAIQAGKTALMLPPSSCFCVNMTTQPIASATLEWQLLGAQGWKVDHSGLSSHWDPKFCDSDARSAR